ncbi:MAG: hypothetical protein AAGF93_00390 [Cyanobacteria bacterium P01_H01_bin.105]
MFPFNRLKSEAEKLEDRDCDSSDIQKFVREYEETSNKAEQQLRQKQAQEQKEGK